MGRSGQKLPSAVTCLAPRPRGPEGAQPACHVSREYGSHTAAPESWQVGLCSVGPELPPGHPPYFTDLPKDFFLKGLALPFLSQYSLRLNSFAHDCLLFIFYFILFFCFFKPTLSAYGGSQARGRIRATATWDLSHVCDLHHSAY